MTMTGRRNGVLTDRTFQVANLVAENVLVDLDGSDEPIELSDEQQQALVAAIVAQNGEEFVLESDNIQRQIVSAINLIGRQDTLTEQRTAFAKAIEAFRSLAVVGSPALTYRRLKKVVGDDVDEELSYKYLTARSEKATTKLPQFLVLVSHWASREATRSNSRSTTSPTASAMTGRLRRSRRRSSASGNGSSGPSRPSASRCGKSGRKIPGSTCSWDRPGFCPVPTSWLTG